MAYYYVQDDGVTAGAADGTDNGRYATKQTGAMSALGVANYYSSIANAFGAPTPPVAGDFVMVGDANNSTETSSIIISGSSPAPIPVVCVDSLNIESSGNSLAVVTSGGGQDVVGSDCHVYGVDLRYFDDGVFSGSCELVGCSLSTGNDSSDVLMILSGDGSALTLIDCLLNPSITSITSKVLRVNGGAFMVIKNPINNSTLTAQALVTDGFDSGGGTLIVEDGDLSFVTGTLIAGIGGSEPNDDAINIRFDNVTIASGVLWHDEDFKSKSQRITASRCASTDIEKEYAYHENALGGDLDHDVSTYRNDDEAFPISAQKISYKIISNADASLATPFWFKFPDIKGVKLSQAGSDKIAIYVTSDLALTDKDIYINAYYPDNVNYKVTNKLSTAPQSVNGYFDILATSTALTSDSSAWTNGLANKYILEIDTSLLKGSDCAPDITVFVTIPSAVIHINSEIVVS